jgi:hypothetical protein
MFAVSATATIEYDRLKRLVLTCTLRLGTGLALAALPLPVFKVTETDGVGPFCIHRANQLWSHDMRQIAKQFPTISSGLAVPSCSRAKSLHVWIDEFGFENRFQTAYLI